ncbi:MAG: hypothetical protein AMS21_10685 [Gemmatimonas sp. SG8_38_2]|nr:MAG: hypothetical protein AMS21_10685 [Gemmatimonas sp. SG8_38_2]
MITELIASLFSDLEVDERFIMHRFRSTRIAMVVGMVLMVGWFTYEMLVNDIQRWDLFLIILAMAVTKVGAMIYLRVTH